MANEIMYEYIYRVYAYNDTLLDEFKTNKEANDKRDNYIDTTGKNAYILMFVLL